MKNKGEVIVLDDFNQLTIRAAEIFQKRADDAIKEKGTFSVALSGGNTPKSLYSLLVNPEKSFKNALCWEKIHFFWGDERHVPHNHKESNYGVANEVMLKKVFLSTANIHPVCFDKDAKKMAQDYEEVLSSYFNLKRGELPIFDFILLGIGDDGHTASLFPESKALHEKNRLVVANWITKFNSYRITLTPDVLNNAAYVVFLVSGKDKAAIIKEVLEGAYEPDQLPSQLIHQKEGDLIWLLDKEAAKFLVA